MDQYHEDYTAMQEDTDDSSMTILLEQDETKGMDTATTTSRSNTQAKLNLPTKLVTIVWKCNRYYLEISTDNKNNSNNNNNNKIAAWKTLWRDPIIARARIPFPSDDSMYNTKKIKHGEPVDESGDDGDDDDDEEEEEMLRFGIRSDDLAMVEQVKQRTRELGYLLYEEYDYKRDKTNPNIPGMHLKPHTHIRHYQERALNQMLGNGHARSGMIVLPCGAGKTMTGIVAAHTIAKPTLVLAPNTTSVYQWRDQFLWWTEIAPDRIVVLTAAEKIIDSTRFHPEQACVLITTYQMISFGGERAAETQRIMTMIQQRSWGLLILDEAHVVPASKYRLAVQSIKAHCRLGLTATLVREDDLIEDLNFLVGPILYQANWMNLTTQGYLANVECVEIWCQLTGLFHDEYQKVGASVCLSTSHQRRRYQQLLCVLNPTKLRAVDFLVRFHEQRGDKIIIFSDCIFSLEYYARMLQRPFIYGTTKEWERQAVLSTFRRDTNEVQTICLSQVGDVAIDLPKANVIVQVSSHFGARRQEAQRLGRILRPKSSTPAQESSSLNAYFYTLVTPETQEMSFSGKRQQFLIEQGYTFKIVMDLLEQAVQQGYALHGPEDERLLLQSILTEAGNKNS